MSSVGSRIRDKRKELKLTQKELGDLVNASSQVISNWERGYTTPNSEDVKLLSKALNVSSSFLIGENELVSQYNKIQESQEPYDSLLEINKLVKKYGIEQMGFFDIDKWKKLSPEDIKMVEEHFKMIVKLANERNKED